MARAGPRKIREYSLEFKLTAVRLSEQPGIQVKAVAAALDIHPFMLSKWRKQVRDGVLRGRGRSLEAPSPREIKRLQDSTWSWFGVLIEQEVIVPSFPDGQPPSKKTLIKLVNGRSNRALADPMHDARSLSNRSRERIFADLLTVLPAT